MTDKDEKRLNDIMNELQRKLFIDPGTNLLNSGYLKENKSRIALKAMKDSANDRRKGTKNGTWSLLFCDIDNLHMINNEISYNEANIGIRAIAGIIQQCIRTDAYHPDSILLPDPSSYEEKRKISMRIGGDEFVVLLPDCTKEEALLVKERINKRIEENKEATRNMTLSIGIADTTDIDLPKDIDDEKAILKFYDDLEDKAADRMREEKYADMEKTVLKYIDRISSELGINLKDPNERQKFIDIINNHYEDKKETKKSKS